MFDKGLFIPIFEAYKHKVKQDLLCLVDIALDTGDKQWFEELMYRLQWVK